MELIFNELSLQPAIDSTREANSLVGKLMEMFSKAEKLGFRKIRFHSALEERELLEGYTFLDWLNTTKNKTLKNWLLGVRVSPFIKTGDERAENEYLSRRYFFENEFIERTEPQGLAAAIIYHTPSVSLPTHEYWKKTTLPVFVVDENVEGVLILKDVHNVCEAASFENEAILDFVGTITTPVLIITELKPDDKKVHLRDDHGKDKLEQFSKRLLQSEYVISVINSLPFNSKATNFIRKTHADGRIELVLYWEDAGYGMAIQTTGRNIHETNAIAEYLKNEFDD